MECVCHYASEKKCSFSDKNASKIVWRPAAPGPAGPGELKSRLDPDPVDGLREEREKEESYEEMGGLIAAVSISTTRRLCTGEATLY